MILQPSQMCMEKVKEIAGENGKIEYLGKLEYWSKCKEGNNKLITM